MRAGSLPRLSACGVPFPERVLRLPHSAVRFSLQQRYDSTQNRCKMAASDMGKAARWLLPGR